MVTVARVEDARSASFVVPVGFTVPLLDSASGRVFLAFLPPAEQAARLARMRGAARSALAARLARIRRRGYELAPSNSVAGITDLSVPLFEADARPAAFLAVPLTQRRDAGRSRAAVIARVRHAAARIDRELASLRRPAALSTEAAE